jgi:hypothetical protein
MQADGYTNSEKVSTQTHIKRLVDPSCLLLVLFHLLIPLPQMSGRPLKLGHDLFSSRLFQFTI